MVEDSSPCGVGPLMIIELPLGGSFNNKDMALAYMRGRHFRFNLVMTGTT